MPADHPVDLNQLRQVLDAIREGVSGTDPSALTTQQLLREIANLDRILTARLDGLEEATKVFKSDLVRVPTELDKQIAALKTLIFEKIEATDKTRIVQFRGIQTQFEERDVRTTQATTSAQTAVSAALQAQKEAAGESTRSLSASIEKSEKGTQARLAQQGEQIDTVERTLNDKIATLSSRVDRSEASGVGRNQVSGPIVGHVLTVLAGIVIAIVTAFIVASGKPPTANEAQSNAARIAQLEQLLREKVQQPSQRTK